MASDIYGKLQAGIQHQQNQELLAAEELYRQVLEEHPNHPDALHLLGVLAYQIGDNEAAEDLIRHAIDSDQAVADYHNNLGEVLRETGRIDEAREQYQQALSLDPEHHNAQMNLQELDQPEPESQTSAADLDEFIPEVRLCLPSCLLSLDDEPSIPGQNLIDLSLLAAHKASKLDMTAIASCFPEDSARTVNVWPGEHYKLLAALVDIIKPGIVIEIGTTTGASALCMKSRLPAHGKIISFDIMPWNQYPGSLLKASDFDKQLEQKIVDMSNPVQASAEQAILEQANIIFVDTDKDNIMAHKLCQLFDSIPFTKPPVIIFDHIRVMPMLKVWRGIRHPKLDLTSFGHWTGTGLVEWNNSSN